MKFFVIIKEDSVRVPMKNFLKLGGVALWKRMVNTLKGQNVFIDTDSQTVCEECISLPWVTAYERAQEHIDFEVDPSFKVSPVLKMIERFLFEHVADENEVIITPHVTSPFISLETMLDAAKKLGEGYESVQACTEHKEFTYFKGKPVNFNEKSVPKTQDLTPVVLGNGAFFVFTKKTFFKHMNRVSPNRYFYPLNFKEAIEIDTLEDLNVAEKFIK